MPSAINYRFRSYEEYTSISFEGPSIPLWELKYEIIAQRKMNSKDFDLLLFDAETNEPITDEYGPISRDSNIIVHRIPLWMSKNAVDVRSKRSDPLPRRLLKEPPENYVCFRCGNKGHFIQHCPTNSDKTFDVVKIRKPSGIPKDFLEKIEPVSGGNPGAVLVTNEGFVRACPQTHVWQKHSTPKLGEIPFHLRCSECGGLLSSPVSGNCGHTFCDGCIHVGERCRVCKAVIEQVAPNKRIEQKVVEFLNTPSSGM